MTELDSVKSNWVQLKCNTDFFINLVCPHCGCACDETYDDTKLVIKDAKASVYCKQCFERIGNAGNDLSDLKIVTITDIDTPLIKSILENSSSIKFIGGVNLYIDFLFLVKNYRKKIEFCNW